MAPGHRAARSTPKGLDPHPAQFVTRSAARIVARNNKEYTYDSSTRPKQVRKGQLSNYFMHLLVIHVLGINYAIYSVFMHLLIIYQLTLF